MNRVERLRQALEQLAPQQVQVEDQSHLHAGHAGAHDGRGHYRVRIVSDAFAGRAPLARHRLVYAAVGEMMQTDVHALIIQALTPQEADDPGKSCCDAAGSAEEGGASA